VTRGSLLKTNKGELWFIDNDDDFDAFCQRIETARHIGVDTEFERRRTYYSELCLVQIAIDGDFACIDPFAVNRFDRLIAALNKNPQPKVMHAARQDLEVLVQTTDVIPTPLYDSQLAAGLAGYPEQIGYADLVFELLGVSLGKSQTRSDWRKRPLTPAQLSYAVDDVRYLLPIKEVLHSRLVELERAAWLEEDCAALCAWDNYDVAVDDAWRRVKGFGNLSPEAFARCVALAAWRETAARRRNLPRNWVLKDAELVDIAAAQPTTTGELADRCNLNAASIRRYGDELLAVTRDAHGASTVEQPRQRQLTAEGRRALKLLGGKVRDIARTLGIAAPLLMTRREMEQLVCGHVPERVHDGWRKDLVGDVALATLDTVAGPLHD
jgi:ribonuclease D